MEESHGTSAVTIRIGFGEVGFQVHGTLPMLEERSSSSVGYDRGAGLLAFFAKQVRLLWSGWKPARPPTDWGRELSKLGHRVRLMPPRYVKAYRPTGRRTMRRMREAICEAVTRPTMRFVEIKTCEQQGTLVLHRVRLMLMRQRVQLSECDPGSYGGVRSSGSGGPQLAFSD